MTFEGLRDTQIRVGALAERLRKAALKREPISRVTDAYRLIDGAGDDFEGVVVERYGDYAAVHWHGGQATLSSNDVARALLELGARGVYLKTRVRGDLRKADLEALSPDYAALGENAPEPLVVNEHGLRFGVNLGGGYSNGLFVDQRDNRQWLKQHAAQRRVLNLFAYTGSFSVAAGSGGASRVTTVDLSARALKRADANLRLNDLEKSQHRLLKADAVDWLRRAVSRKEEYDVIVLDPPSFASVGGATFSVSRQYLSLVTQCVSLLSAGGTLLAVTNHQATSLREFHELLRSGAMDAGRRVRELTPLEPPPDFTLARKIPDLGTKCALLSV